MNTLDFATQPLFCPRCGQEVLHLFCLPCMLMRLDRADILAHTRDIRAMARRPVSKLRAAAAICTGPMRVGEAAHSLPKKIVAHPKCVRELMGRLNEAMPKQEPAQPGELPFSEEALVVE
jgi:hypothetical protein